MKTIQLKNQRELVIRPTVKKDAPRVIDYIHQVAGESDFLTFGEGEFDISIEKEEEIIENVYNSSNSLFLVAEISDEIVGNLTFMGGRRSRVSHFGEFGVSVAKDYWGLGIGRQLLVYLIEWAQETKIIRKINLKVRTDNTRAITLYENLGFMKEGTITRFFYMNDRFYDVYEMGLAID